MTDVHRWLRGVYVKHINVLVTNDILPFDVGFVDLFCVVQAVSVYKTG